MFRHNVASVGNTFKGTRKVKVLSLSKTIKKSTFRAKAPSARNDDFSFIVSSNERTFTFRVMIKYAILIGLSSY